MFGVGFRCCSRHIAVLAHHTAGHEASPINRALKQLYLSGEGKHKIGQPKAVVVTTGGGGHLVGELLAQSGASSFLLEAVVPYGKQATLDFLSERGQSAEGVGFCSSGMALRLATSARDRAMELEPVLARWADVHGVSCTATIMSHFKRKGDYRAHAAAVDAQGLGSVYSHTLVKGARGRMGEDRACALLACRALTDSVNKSKLLRGDLENAARDLRTEGVVLEELVGAVNALGEEANGVEQVPDKITRQAQFDNFLLLPNIAPTPKGVSQATGNFLASGCMRIVAPNRRLPSNAIIVWCDGEATGGEMVATVEDALIRLGRQGDGKAGAWAEVQAPVLFATRAHNAEALLASLTRATLGGSKLVNYAVLGVREKKGVQEEGGVASLAAAYPSADFLVQYGRGGQVNDHMEHMDHIEAPPRRWDDRCLAALHDDSPSTRGVSGVYCGRVQLQEAPLGDAELEEEGGSRGAVGVVPNGQGTMAWDNGITYAGHWLLGKYHGRGSKLYSKGGGFEGQWRHGCRQGTGVSLYNGKWGYDKWEGPFVGDLPHGNGVMYMRDGSCLPFAFEKGQPLQKA